jgi:hypothetical protein
MPRVYKPTGRPVGRPTGDRSGSPLERVERAKTLLPNLRHFPHLVRAVDRALAYPNLTVLRSPYPSNPVDVDVMHVYSPAERGQILAFVWWAYVNRKWWAKRRRLAAITLLSPLMLFSSTFFEEMTGIPFKNASKWMTRPEGMSVSRVTGSVDMRSVHLALEAATRGDEEFRLFASEMHSKGFPKAAVSRLTGVPPKGLLDPHEGIQFTPVWPDLHTFSVSSRETYLYWLRDASELEKNLMPVVYGQEWVRDVLPETGLIRTVFTATPVPRNGEDWYHFCIPGLPKPHRAKRLGPRYFENILAWETKYLLPGLMPTRDDTGTDT